MWYNLKLFRYTFYEQSSDVIKNIIATIVVLFSYLCVKVFTFKSIYGNVNGRFRLNGSIFIYFIPAKE